MQEQPRAGSNEKSGLEIQAAASLDEKETAAFRDAFVAAVQAVQSGQDRAEVEKQFQERLAKTLPADKVKAVRAWGDARRAAAAERANQPKDGN